MTEFSEYEFKTVSGEWIRTCVESSKIDAVLEKMATVTEVRYPLEQKLM